MTPGSIREYDAAQRERYRRADRGQKGRILDEVVALAGYHRKAAIRLLRGDRRPGAGRPREGISISKAAGEQIELKGSGLQVRLPDEFKGTGPTHEQMARCPRATATSLRR